MTRRTWLGWLGGLVIEQASGQVSADVAAPDFEALFDGESLAGWTAIGGEPGCWRVVGGLLTAGSGKNWLSTNRSYTDFDLRLDYRVERGGNSGVLLRAPHEGDPSYAGLEVQILDDQAPRHRELKPEQYTGSVYGVIAARRGSARPAGTWNRLAIRLEGSTIRVDLNATCVVSARLVGHTAPLARTHPGLARSRGFIGLQAHESPVWFRNLAIKSLA